MKLNKANLLFVVFSVFVLISNSSHALTRTLPQGNQVFSLDLSTQVADAAPETESLMESSSSESASGLTSDSGQDPDDQGAANETQQVTPLWLDVNSGVLGPKSDIVDLLLSSDDRDVVIRRNVLSRYSSSLEFEVSSVSPFESVSVITFQFESGVSSRGGNIIQVVSLFNYETDSFEEFDSRAAAQKGDATITITPSGAPGRFVDAETGRVTAKIKYFANLAPPGFQFVVNADHAVWSVTRADSYVSGDRSIFDRLIIGAETSCQRIAIIGDSQETSPGGAGNEFCQKLMANAFYSLGPASETRLCFSRNTSNDGVVFTRDGTDFQGNVATSYNHLPNAPIKYQSNMPYGFAAVLNKRADDTGHGNPSDILNNGEDWFQWTDLRAEYFFMGNPAGPDYMNIQYRPTSSSAAFWSRPLVLEETIDFSLSTIGDGAFLKHVTATLVDDPIYRYPQVILRSHDGTDRALGGRCAGMRWVDHGRSGGMVFQSFGKGGATSLSWLMGFGDAYPQFRAYGPWDAIWLCFGANDSGSGVDPEDFKISVQNLIDRLRDNDWRQGAVPIILIGEPDRLVSGSFSATDRAKLLGQWAVLVELAAENDEVVAIDGFRLMKDAGYDPSNATHTGDGVHLSALWNWMRADLIWQTIVDGS